MGSEMVPLLGLIVTGIAVIILGFKVDKLEKEIKELKEKK